MSSPFKVKDTRSKLLLWALAILFGGFFLLSNSKDLTTQLTAVYQQASEEVGVPFQQDTFENLFSGDADNDGLDNVLEVLLGGDIQVVDTDGDGFTDYQEFLSGYPLNSKEQVAVDQSSLREFFELFDNNYMGPYYINDQYYQARIEGLLEEGRVNEALMVLEDEPSTRVFETIELYLIEKQSYEVLQLVAERHLKINPDNAETLFTLGYAYHLQGKEEEAKQYYQQSELLGGTEPALFNNLGAIIASEGEMDLAIEYYKQAVQLDPETLIYQQNLVDALNEVGKTDEAEMYMNNEL